MKIEPAYLGVGGALMAIGAAVVLLYRWIYLTLKSLFGFGEYFVGTALSIVFIGITMVLIAAMMGED